MGIFAKKTCIELSSGVTAKRLIIMISGLFAAIALICVFGCQQTAGVKSTVPAPKQIEQTGKAKPEDTGALELTNAQCVLCHQQQPQTIDAKGGLHKSEVGCLDCHREHPPDGTQAVPGCEMCHSGEPHYELEQCGTCHTDTHAPLDLTLEGEISAPCLTCHQQQGDEVAKHPSAHTDLACNECHTAHRKVPDCMECHSRHTEDMVYETCVSCHPVHMPLSVSYDEDISSDYCGACHGEALDLLQKNTTKHHDLSCAYCHRNKHKVVPPCFACHSQPHSDTMLKKFPTCGECHSTAHDLKG